MGCVVIVVAIGDICQSLQEVLIMQIADAKLAMMTAIQAVLAYFDLAVEMYTKPWMVDASIKSFMKFIFENGDFQEESPATIYLLIGLFCVSKQFGVGIYFND